MLAGRNPHTDERLITAQGSAGRRPTLGSGAHTRLAADGEPLFGVPDAASVLGVSRRELSGCSMSAPPSRPARWPRTRESTSAADLPFDLPRRSQHARTSRWTSRGPPVGPPASALTSVFNQPGGSYLVPLVEPDGSRWVRAIELAPLRRRTRRRGRSRRRSCSRDRDDQLDLRSGRLAGVTSRYLRGVAATTTSTVRRSSGLSLRAASPGGRSWPRTVARRGSGWWCARTSLSSWSDAGPGSAGRLRPDAHHRKVAGCPRPARRPATRRRAAVDPGGQRLGHRLAPGPRWDGSMASPFPPKASPWRRSGTSPPARWTRSRTTTTSSSTRPPGRRQPPGPVVTAAVRTGARGVRWPPPRCAITSPPPWASAGGPAAKAAGRSTASATRSFESSPGGATTSTARSTSSKRRSRRGAHPNEVEHIVLRTRPAKTTPADDLVAAWRERAARHGLIEALADVVGHQHGEQALDRRSSLMPAPMASAREGRCSPVPTPSALAGHPVPPATAGRSPCCAARNDCSS